MLRSVCPACREHAIYDGLLTVFEKCPHCGFPLRKHDAGDGPVFFAMVFSSIIVVIAALLVDALFVVPLWLHVILWGISIVVLSIYFLRIIKTFLIHQQYKHNVDNYRDYNAKS